MAEATAGTSSREPSKSALAAAAVLLASAAAAIGFFAGMAAREKRKSRRRPPSELCECGVLISRVASPEERRRHTLSARHRRNLFLLRSSSKVVVCEEVGEYRAAAQSLVTKEDLVLEVGCHVGGTTKVLAESAGCLVGVDKQPDLVAQARVRLPHIRFEVFDAFEAPRILALAQSLRPGRISKVFIDISGSRDLSTVVRLMDIIENTLRPELVVVKSQTLKRVLLRSRLWIHHPSLTEET